MYQLNYLQTRLRWIIAVLKEIIVCIRLAAQWSLSRHHLASISYTKSSLGLVPWQAESTLNQLLTCMDGLVTRESGRPVVVIAATNRPEAWISTIIYYNI